MSQGLARARTQPPMDALLKVADRNRRGAFSSHTVHPHGKPRTLSRPAPGHGGGPARKHAGHPRAQRPAVTRAATRRGMAAAGHHPRRPRAATRTCRAWPAATWRRRCGNLPPALRSWRQRPGGALTILSAPSAEA